MRAAEDVLGFVSDDVWEDTRAWAVTLGEQAYKSLLEDSELLKSRLRELDSQDAIGPAGRLLT